MSNVLPFPSHRPDAGDDDDEHGRSAGLKDAIGEALRNERLDQERTLGDVADAAAVSLPYLSEVERGRKDVSSDVLGAICDALELPLPELLERAAEHLRVNGTGVGATRSKGTTGFQLRAA